ncbi:MAG: oligosaccharide flippase family protein, partial [Candidatus Ratteibacteria bacterium]|nr:oligosaccharide flippase family protein [Candidatus Ratteibacteria bacterium]
MKDKSMGNEHQEDTLRKRYFFKLSSNFVSGGISAIIQLMVPRSLGPTAYGNFGFLTAFFDNIAGTLDMGSSFWFYTKLSQKKDNKIVIFYRFIMSALILLVLGFVIVATLTTIHGKIWPGQSNQIIYMAMVFSIASWILGVKTKIIDAYGLTVDAEKGKIVQRIIALIIILVLFLLNRLNLFTFFIYHYFIIAILWIFFDLLIRRKGFSAGFKFKIKREESKAYFKDLFKYANPLVVYTIIGLIIGVLDRWLLQKFGGSIQQGFFTLSYKISDI